MQATFIGLTANVFLTGGKFAAGILGHSHALVADGVESLADIFSSIVVWRGLVMAAEPADEDHPYGHGKAEPLAGALVSVMLIAAAVWITVEAVRDSKPHGAPAPFTLAVLVAVVVIKEGLYRFVSRASVSTQSAAVRSDAWHHRSDALTSLAAAIGISVAIAGGKRYESADDVAACVAALIIAFNGWRTLKPAVSELMDRAPSRALREQITRIGAGVPGVERVEKCLVRKMGYEFFVDMHIEVDPQMTVLRAHEISHLVKDSVREKLSRVHDVLVHIEPAKRIGQKTEKND